MFWIQKYIAFLCVHMQLIERDKDVDILIKKDNKLEFFFRLVKILFISDLSYIYYKTTA